MSSKIIFGGVDTRPDDFTFTDVTNAALNTAYTTSITPTGYDTITNWSVSGGTGSTDGLTFATSGTISPGEIFYIRLTSSSSFSTAVSATATIGGVSDTYSVTTRAADTTPDQFTFNDDFNVPLNQTRVAFATPTGYDYANWTVTGGAGLAISLSNPPDPIPDYATSGIIYAGETFYIRLNTSPNYFTSVSATATIGGVSDTYTSTTLSDINPDPFSFTSTSGVERSTTITSNQITVTGLSAGSTVVVSASGGTVDAGTSVLSGTFASNKTVTVSGSGTIVVAARVTSSSSFSTASSVTVTIGNYSTSFTVTTRAVDTTPNPFTSAFTDVTGQSTNSTVESNTITISGFDPSISVTVTASGGTVDAGTSVLSGTFASSKTVTTSGTGTIKVAARVTTSGSLSTPSSVTVTVGGLSDTFTATTRDPDLTPNPFYFTDVTGAELSTVFTSNTATVTGFEPNWTFTITATETGVATVDAGTTSLSGTFASSKTITTSASGTFVVAARVTSSSTFSTARSATITAGTYSDTFTVTTKTVDNTPNPFTFTDVTNASLSTVYTSETITVSGLEPNFTLTVTAGGGTVDAGTTSLSGIFSPSKSVTTSATGTLVVAARVTSSSSSGTTVNSLITIGSGSDVYSVTTGIIGSASYTTPGVYNWTCPAGVTSVSVVAVGGAGFGSGYPYTGGAGLGWKNNISVTPGTNYTVAVGSASTTPGMPGTDSYFINTSTVRGGASPGGSGASPSYGRVGTGGSYTGDGGGNGGSSPAIAAIGSPTYNGAGGAGGYTGNGGDGGLATSSSTASTMGTSGSGGGGGGGSGARTPTGGGWPGGAGGGVGILGQGSNGAAAASPFTSTSSTYGVNGSPGSGGSGTSYGGGATSSSGGGGAVRIIWGPGRSYPNNAT